MYARIFGKWPSWCPCVHVVCPFTTYRLGLSVPNKVSIQITIIILKLFRTISFFQFYYAILFSHFVLYIFIDTN